MVGVFDVRAHGAVGNGTADDTTAIQNAINAASAAGGGSVTFDKGEFRITGALQITSANVHLVGLGPAVSAIIADYASTSTTPVIVIRGTGTSSRTHDVSVRKLAFANKREPCAVGALFALSCTRNVTIADCAVGPGGYGTFSQTAILGHTGVPDSTADSVVEFYFLNNYVKTNSAGVPRTGGNHVNAIQLHSGSIAVIRDCMFNNRKAGPDPSDYTEAAIAQESYPTNWDGLVVSGCTFEDYPRLVKVVGAGMANVRITDNIADGSAWATIYVGAASWQGDSGASWNWMIANNVFDGEKETVDGVTTLWPDSMGIRVSEALGGQVRNVTISGNVLRACRGNGVHVDNNVSGVTVTGNLLHNVAQHPATAAIKIGSGTTAVAVSGNSALIETIPGYTPSPMAYGIEWVGTGIGRTQSGNTYVGASTLQFGSP